jgi:hypothetical protein
MEDSDEISIGDFIIPEFKVWMEFLSTYMDDIFDCPWQFIPPKLIVKDIEMMPYDTRCELFVADYRGRQICLWKEDINELIKEK